MSLSAHANTVNEEMKTLHATIEEYGLVVQKSQGHLPDLWP
jgi:hypothetical protein